MFWSHLALLFSTVPLSTTFSCYLEHNGTLMIPTQSEQDTGWPSYDQDIIANCSCSSRGFQYAFCARFFISNRESWEGCLCMNQDPTWDTSTGTTNFIKGELCTDSSLNSLGLVFNRSWKWACLCYHDLCNNPAFGISFESPSQLPNQIAFWSAILIACLIILSCFKQVLPKNCTVREGTTAV